MTVGIAQIHVKRQRGKLVVQGMGQTPRGQKYIKRSEDIAAPKMTDKEFKAELATAVAKLYGSEA